MHPASDPALASPWSLPASFPGPVPPRCLRGLFLNTDLQHHVPSPAAAPSLQASAGLPPDLPCTPLLLDAAPRFCCCLPLLAAQLPWRLPREPSSDPGWSGPIGRLGASWGFSLGDAAGDATGDALQHTNKDRGHLAGAHIPRAKHRARLLAGTSLSKATGTSLCPLYQVQAIWPLAFRVFTIWSL